MSIKLKKNQSLAAELLAHGYKSIVVAERLNIRPETISRWKQEREFNELVDNIHLGICTEIKRPIARCNSECSRKQRYIV